VQDEFDIIRDVSNRLESAGIEYMLTGSMALSFYTEPRMTRDIDLVIAINRNDAGRMVELFSPDYLVSREAVDSSLMHQSMFNLIHNESIIKVDCIIRKRDEYRLHEFGRRKRIKVRDLETWVVSKEDLIVSKLFWAKDSHSEIQLKDVKNLIATGCDQAYVAKWTSALGISELWKEVRHD
jgi:hypothetical protein